ncbi:hypothetical protein F2Q69_00052798 [Brassica cretica]|uniref:DUF223 domain-containing protein n=1 Tax=Brassica cretica TaxID=69181 RepID=A0A8S9N172_BRACR|nr:hypothetical protein F2Q69_00052798 [Brassica cretica]
MESYSNFTLSPATGLYRPTNHVYKMDFVSQTLTTDSNLQCDSMFLKLHDFANIINGLHDTCFLKGELQVSNAFDTSLVLINPDIKEAKSLKQMFHGDANAVDLYQHKNDKILIQKQRKKWSHYPFKTIQEIKHSDKGGNCRVICTVYAIDTSSGWYYLDCMVCKNKVLKPTVSFDEIIAQHGGVNFAGVLLPWFHQGTSWICLCRIKLIEDQEVLPPEIVEIYGKTNGFGISDDENNMIGGADKFNAMKVWNLNDIMWKRIKSLHQMSTYSRKKQCINDEGNKNKSG